jgi:glutathione S-transferase
MSAGQPVLYSFRRCPYAMRARLALHVSGTPVEHREVVLRDKPQALLDASPKGTVPVLVLPGGAVLEESLDVMHWALARYDPEDWLAPGAAMTPLIEACDGGFKHHLDRYKYATRYEGADAETHRDAALDYLRTLDARLRETPQLFGPAMSLADAAIFPFVRQFAHTDRAWFDALDLPGLQAWLAGHLASPRFADIMVKHAPWSPPG